MAGALRRPPRAHRGMTAMRDAARTAARIRALSPGAAAGRRGRREPCRRARARSGAVARARAHGAAARQPRGARRGHGGERFHRLRIRRGGGTGNVSPAAAGVSASRCPGAARGIPRACRAARGGGGVQGAVRDGGRMAAAAEGELSASRRGGAAEGNFPHPAAQEQRAAFPEHAARLTLEAVRRAR